MSDERPRHVDVVDESTKLPRWVPLTIGALLIAIASAAVYTGVTYRRQGLGRAFRRLPMVGRIDRGGAPGEPEAGASRIMHGDAGDAVPPPGTAGSDDDEVRVAIIGGPDGVVPSIKLAARRGIIIRVDPSDAVVYVNDRAMGTAAQFSTEDQVWEFPDVPGGTFHVRLVADGYKEYEYVVTSDPDAEVEVAPLEVKLARQ